MAKPLSPVKSKWVKARLYHLIAPLVALAVVWALSEKTTLIDLTGIVDGQHSVPGPRAF